MLSLTSLYPNADIENHPRLCVLFNNVSKFQPKQKLMQQYGGGSDEDLEYSEDEEALQSHMDIPTWKQYIEQYRTSLLHTLENHYKDKATKDFLEERIAKLFPDENFYFF